LPGLYFNFKLSQRPVSFICLYISGKVVLTVEEIRGLQKEDLTVTDVKGIGVAVLMDENFGNVEEGEGGGEMREVERSSSGSSMLRWCWKGFNNELELNVECRFKICGIPEVRKFMYICKDCT
jgi:hypothetical protein